MRIHGMMLHNITSYTAAEIRFDERINVISAANNAGKTTIVDALMLALGGQCGRTDAAGRQADSRMLRHGEKDGGIGVALEVNGEELVVSYHIPGGLTIRDHEGGQKELRALLYEKLGVSGPGPVLAALNTKAFAALKPSEQKGLLFGLLGLSFERDDVCRRIAAESPMVVQGIEAKVLKILDAAPAKLFDGTGQTFANLYKHFYELRRNLKRQLKDMGEQAPPSLVPDAPDKEHLLGEVEGLEQLLYEVRSRMDKAVDLEAKAGRLDDEITKLRGQLETAADTKLAQAQLDTVRAKMSMLERDAAASRARVDTLDKAIAAISKAGANRECPLAPEDVTCPLTKPKREELIGKLTDERNAAEKDEVPAVDVAELLNPRLAKLRLMASAPDRATLEGMIAERQKELDDLPDIGDPEAGKAEVRDLEARINECKAALEEIIRAEGARGATERQAAERARLTGEIEVLETLVHLTSPQGIPGKLLEQTITPVEAAANERLAMLTGGRYQLQLSMDPDFHVVVTHDGVESDLDDLSSSEQMRVGIIIQTAISRLSGLRVMVIDDADTLDPHNRALLTATLRAIRDEFDTVLVFSTGDPAAVTDPGIEDVAVYRIVDGEIERVREEAMVR